MKDLNTQAQAMREASAILRRAPGAQRNRVLKELASLLIKNSKAILKANALDVAALDPNMTASFRDRLTLDKTRIEQMGASLKKVASLPDPVNEVVEKRKLKNGLLLSRVRAPLGIILMIFEARPNVVTEAFSLAMKSGNCLILRGGKESIHTCKVLFSLVEEAIKKANLPPSLFWGVEDTGRELAQTLMTQNKWIDVLVPRGGDSLIEYVVEHATIPIIKNDRGLCHIYVHKDADKKMAVEIVENAKCQRPGVCNSAETLLIHKDRASILADIYVRLAKSGVEWFGCPTTLKTLKNERNVRPASDTNFSTEYLDLKMNCRVVDSLEDAIAHIEKFGSRHSETIVTKSKTAAREFQNTVDAAAVYWNASTRFTDGFEFGLGGELGISTQKLHVRGPVGLRELTSLRWVIDGKGQIR